MRIKRILWDHELLDMLCRITGHQKNILQFHIIRLAADLGRELPVFEEEAMEHLDEQ